ncbi:hypothetical protein CAC42_6617 [Sphaceloma murrayae]|uniref:non-specific serine/threonine protein kinase n=1 Tax=Sphaceloma murrayae TaxID=2082308 RepID=A0A2K1QG00_9PEZI|nr:hypothetical protein CAC42_6617 [Sphaceloma murrayae]
MLLRQPSMWRRIFRTKVVKATRSHHRKIIDTDVKVEEERLPHYTAQEYFPVHIGDLFESRYEILGKLGYGAHSTVWLCRDRKDPRYAALKVSTSIAGVPNATYREKVIYEHLSKLPLGHPGGSMIRSLHDTFEIQGPSGEHQCLVLEPMFMSMLEMMRPSGEPLPLPLLKACVRRILKGLDFLHSEAGVVHTGEGSNTGYDLPRLTDSPTDLKTDNIMLSIDDESMLDRFVEAEKTAPSPCKVIDSTRAIYASRPLPKPLKGQSYGVPMLCDFGEARIGLSHSTRPRVQPDIYRAPEVMFEMPWGPPVDIWNLAGLIWDLFENEHLFGGVFDEDGVHDPFLHLAMITGLLGPAPPEFVTRSETTDQCFDSQGRWIAHEHAPVPRESLEDREHRLEGLSQEVFLDFIRAMLQWLPEKRLTAKQLLEHAWLQET